MDNIKLIAFTFKINSLFTISFAGYCVKEYKFWRDT